MRSMTDKGSHPSHRRGRRRCAVLLASQPLQHGKILAQQLDSSGNGLDLAAPPPHPS